MAACLFYQQAFAFTNAQMCLIEKDTLMSPAVQCHGNVWSLPGDLGGAQGVAGQLPCQEHALLQLEWDKIDLKQATNFI